MELFLPLGLTCIPGAGSDAVDIGSVLALTVRRPKSSAPTPVTRVPAIAGVGLDGDIHADPLSPRQLLLAGAGAYRALALPANALRENLLLDVDVTALKSGAILQVGATAALWLTFDCEPCGRLNLRQPGLSKAIGRQRGMLARVLRGGDISVGDRIALAAAQAPRWSLDWRERIRMVVASMPPGVVVEYRQLARLAGVPAGYCRVFPRVLRDMGPGFAARGVAMRSASKAPRWLGDGLFDIPALSAERG